MIIIINMKQHAGVLILKNNRTYGHVKKQNGKEGKLLYKCIPNDNNIPSILIPYEMKEIGFSKVFNNIYIIFEFNETLLNKDKDTDTDTDIKIIGTLTQSLGSVEVIYNFFEYQLYCKNIHNSIQFFNKETFKQVKNLKELEIKQLFMNKYPSIQDRTREQIFSIDPEDCCDFDDAFSIKHIDNSNILLSIYISNVSIWLDYLNLFESFSHRISTIYLPNKKISMLPSILSDCFCSLKANCDRIAFVMDITLNENHKIIYINYYNSVINIYKNYVYDSKELIKDENYILLLNTVKKIHTKYPLISCIHDSHYLVEYLMVFMNCYTGLEMKKFNNGIFRSLKIKEPIIGPIIGLPNELLFLNNNGGIYVDYNKEKAVSHELLMIDSYIHITSPIRRIVDLLNIIQLQINLGLIELNKKASIFLFKWLNDLEYINNNMNSIKKVQNESKLLHLITINPKLIDEIYDAIVTEIEIVEKNGIYCYNCYISKLKMFSRLKTREELNEYQKINIKLYLFNNEAKYKKKIKIELNR